MSTYRVTYLSRSGYRKTVSWSASSAPAAFRAVRAELYADWERGIRVVQA